MMTSSSMAAEDEPTTSSSTAPMGPPPPKNPNPDIIIPSDDTQQQQQEDKSIQVQQQSSVPYTIPEWSGIPCHRFYFEVLKDGSIMDQFDVYKKGAYMFGRVDLCDFVLEHPTISRFHAVIQFRKSGAAYLYDVGSTHGTFVNKNQVKKRVYVDLHVGDVIRFGQSSRLYIFQGPSELMPVEKDLKIIRESKMQQEMIDREDSLRRARMNSSLADGISWGMGEDAIEEAEDDDDEVTWQTYKGQLTEKQEKTREKIIKRTEKIAHMKKEIDLIRAKDISQGGLTQGQQTQIARNEQRMTQIMEELENLEETLNESIRESIGARSGNISRGGRKGAAEDDEDFSSDDDEFYDRTKKKPLTQNAGENQIVETADTLLNKRDALMKEFEDKKESLEREKNKMASETAVENEAGDALDAYMSGLSSQLVLDKTAHGAGQTTVVDIQSAKKNMSGPQCCSNPPTLNPAGGAGHVEKLGGLDTYVSGLPDSKLAVFLISDIFGYEAPNLRKLADKIAAAGFYVVVPDFFYGDPYAPEAGKPIQTWLEGHGADKGVEDAKPVIEALKSKGISAIGAVGFCWGAKVVVKLAKREVIQAAVLCHPSFVTVDDIKGVEVPIAVLGAEIDQMSPPALLKQFEEVITANNEVDGYVKIFPKVAHGWTVRYDLGDEAAVKPAEQAHQNLLEWIAKYVK